MRKLAVNEDEQRHLQRLIYDCQHHGISPNPEFVLAVLLSLQADEHLGTYFQIDL